MKQIVFLNGRERNPGRRFFTNRLGQPRRNPLTQTRPLMQSVGQRDLLEGTPHPLFEALPEVLQITLAMMHAGAVGFGACMFSAVTWIVEERLTQRR